MTLHLQQICPSMGEIEIGEIEIGEIEKNNGKDNNRLFNIMPFIENDDGVLEP